MQRVPHLNYMFDEEALLNTPSHLDAPICHAGSSHSLFIVTTALVTSGISVWAISYSGW